MTTTTHQHRDVHRRIRNILDIYPATKWDAAEAEAVLTALEGIIRGRQGGSVQR